MQCIKLIQKGAEALQLKQIKMHEKANIQSLQELMKPITRETISTFWREVAQYHLRLTPPSKLTTTQTVVS